MALPLRYRKSYSTTKGLKEEICRPEGVIGIFRNEESAWLTRGVLIKDQVWTNGQRSFDMAECWGGRSSAGSQEAQDTWSEAAP